MNRKYWKSFEITSLKITTHIIILKMLLNVMLFICLNSFVCICMYVCECVYVCVRQREGEKNIFPLKHFNEYNTKGMEVL